tara:strand:+ start:839 stop:991 length:153 start_codon:yes stop_codon:yes gene_type:complete
MHILKTLSYNVKNSSQLEKIEIEINVLCEDAKLNIENKRDLSKIDTGYIS